MTESAQPTSSETLTDAQNGQDEREFEQLASPTDVILRDGSTARLRPPQPGEEESIVDFLKNLSPESYTQRFHGAARLDVSLLKGMIDCDWVEQGALIATRAAGDGEDVVAFGSYDRLRLRERAEVAFVVADHLQTHGLGTQLFNQLAARASLVGIRDFLALVRADNMKALGMLTHSGFSLHRELDQGIVEMEISLAPTEHLLEWVGARDHLAVVASLRPFFVPESVAVLGASPRPGSVGGELFRNILGAGFRGVVYPVNPTGSPVGGVRAYKSVREINDPVDLAVVCTPARVVLDVVGEALRAGVRAIAVISAGFAEVGAEGQKLQDELLALVRSHGGRLIGPNVLGVAAARSQLNATFGAGEPSFGSLALSSQSGALGIALLDAARARGLGLSAFVSIGNKADVSSNDLLEWFEDDESTELVMLYLESFGNPQKFGRIARRVARRKPILALKSGRSSAGIRAASSHTAALASSDTATSALFHQAGVIRAETFEELLDTASLLAGQPLPDGNRVAIVTNAGGLAVLCADACEAAGLALPDLTEETKQKLRELLPEEASLGNPIDMLGSAPADVFERGIRAVLEDPRIDAIIALSIPTVRASTDAIVRAIEHVIAAAKPAKPILPVFAGSPKRRFGSLAVGFSYPESAAHALAHAARRAQWLRRPLGSIPELDGIDLAAGAAVVGQALAREGDGWLNADEIRSLLGAYGIPYVKQRVAPDMKKALETAAEYGYPVVVKSTAPGAHKTDQGLVVVGISNAEELEESVSRIGLPILVQQQVQGKVELLAGVVQDPVFGSLVGLGPGGVFAELIASTTYRIAPLTDRDAEELVSSDRTARLVGGFRGAPAADRGALIDLVLRLARLATDHPEIVELDLNPVFALPDGYVPVDARIRVTAAVEGPPLKGW
ncbi:MAG: bifunctional acetate--CoA ligase family protein/GNAT family N-acetyltransferase [Gaiellaceae bacterium]